MLLTYYHFLVLLSTLIFDENLDRVLEPKKSSDGATLLCASRYDAAAADIIIMWTTFSFKSELIIAPSSSGEANYIDIYIFINY